MELALGWHTYGGEEDRALAGGVRRVLPHSTVGGISITL